MQETRHWDEATGRTGSMRSKEEAYDYRYFPEPDLVPVEPSSEWIAAVAAALPALPAARRASVAERAGMAPDDDPVITVVRLGLEPYVDAVVAAGGDAGLAVRRLANEVAAQVDTVDRLDAQCLCLAHRDGGTTGRSPRPRPARSSRAARIGRRPRGDRRRPGFRGPGTDALEAVVDQVVADHPDEWARYAAGEDKLTGFFIGHIKTATGGKADLKAASALLRSRRG